MMTMKGIHPLAVIDETIVMSLCTVCRPALNLAPGMEKLPFQSITGAVRQARQPCIVYKCHRLTREKMDEKTKKCADESTVRDSKIRS